MKQTIENEMLSLQKCFGVDEISLVLGDLASYKELRKKYTYKEIFDEIDNCFFVDHNI